jgi:PII-like signaling protein
MADTPPDAVLLRIVIGSDDVFGNRPLAEAIVFKAREARLAGATAYRGVMGFGLSAHIHEPGLLISHDAPVIVEIVDTPDRIDAFVPELDRMLDSGLVTMQPVKVLRGGRKP